MEFDLEPFKILYVWTVAYSIVEPVVALMNYLLYVRFGMKSMFQLYPSANPFLVVIAEYVYLSIIIVKTMYVYKYILKKPSYYPGKNDSPENYRDFILLFIGIMILMDILWALTIKFVGRYIPFLAFLNNYSRVLGFYALVRPIIFGLTLLMVSYTVLHYMKDLEAIISILFAIFIITMASF